MIKLINPGDTIFFLNRSPYTLEQIVEMKVETKQKELVAVATNSSTPKRLTITEQILEKNTESKTPFLFSSRESAKQQQQFELDLTVQTIQNQSKEELLKELFQEWLGDNIIHNEVHDAMVTKIKNEFSVDVLN